LFDGAHNEEGARALRDHLELFAERPLTIVFGCMEDKPADEILRTLGTVADQLVLTPIDNPRAASIDQLHDFARETFSDRQIRLASSSREAMEIARGLTSDGLICVTGSLYLIGEIRPLIREQEVQ
jgi:dihydrofolate synthase/folylpolyglutamate synthase